jgi:hypothetical protein
MLARNRMLLASARGGKTIPLPGFKERLTRYQRLNGYHAPATALIGTANRTS